ncbi:hypothetical protein C8R46DRAFT_1322316 [Mycena filopes]|nr:hypothetical protein C8R46DRAFT_1322316 [Mycena filopes]
MSGIAAHDTPSDVRGDLFPRALAWAQFFWMMRDCLPTVRRSEKRLYLDFLRFSRAFADQSSKNELILSSPGFFRILFAAWALVLADKTEWDEGMSTMFPFICTRSTDRDSILEMIEGAARRPSSSRAANITTHTLNFTKRIDTILQGGDGTDADNELRPSALLPVLAALDALKVVTFALCASGGTIEHDPGPMVSDSLQIIGLLCQHDYGHTNLLSALNNGLLLAQLNYFIDAVLTPSTVYYHLLEIIHSSYQEVKQLTSAPAFQQSTTFEPWSTFAEVLMLRYDLKVAYDKKKTAPNSACDNADCGRLGTKTALRRCAGCSTFLYCSPNCQVSDWRTGGHRQMCSVYDTLRRDTCDEAFSSRDRAFMRFLLGADYLVRRSQIQHAHMTIARDSPRQGCVTIFDYMCGPVNVTTHTFPLSAKKLPFGNDIWADLGRRAGRSHGRTQIHVVLLRNTWRPGVQGRALIVPMRASTSLLPEIFVSMAIMPPEFWSIDRFEWEFERLKLPKEHVEIH